MTAASERNSRIEKLVKQRLAAVAAGESEPALPDSISDALDSLFRTKAYGFREVVLTCVCAWEAGIEFDPVNRDFYKCNPRSVYERGIRPALAASGLPHMKSGPLNVAKNINTLDKAWANGRRPEWAAMAAVDVLEWLVAANGKERLARCRAVLDGVLARLRAEAERLESLAVEPREDLTLYELFSAVGRFIAQAPDAGNTPQTIVSLILAGLFSDTPFTVFGSGKACETNLTAKKPADAWIEDDKEQIAHLYEVTVKPIDRNRIEDSVDSVLAHGKGHNEVIWLCRMPGDVIPLEIEEGDFVEERGVRCEFVDLMRWVLCGLELLGCAGREAFLNQLSEHVGLPETSEKAKAVWRDIWEGE